jgi:hypothetical protein
MHEPDGDVATEKRAALFPETGQHGRRKGTDPYNGSRAQRETEEEDSEAGYPATHVPQREPDRQEKTLH